MTNMIPQSKIRQLSSEMMYKIHTDAAFTKEKIIDNKAKFDVGNTLNLEQCTNENLNDTFELPEFLEARMFDHQRDGLLWLRNLHMQQSGGILGDDMGLGKTYQTICLLTGLMKASVIKKVLIISPVSVLQSWIRELNEFLLPFVKYINIELINSDMGKPKRQRIIRGIFSPSRYATVVVSSYTIVSNMSAEFTGGTWDYIILDEGHIIKNPQTKLFKSMMLLRAHHKLVLTGTPIQNNLMEYWALLTWATNSSLLGTHANFKKTFANVIQAGQDPNANDRDIYNASKAAEKLLAMVKPFVLRRKKIDNAEILNLKEKTELVVWIPLSTQQRTLYENYLNSQAAARAMDTSSYPVEIVNYLKTLCRHPILCEATVRMKSKLTYRDGYYGGSNAPVVDDDEVNYIDDDDDNYNDSSIENGIDDLTETLGGLGLDRSAQKDKQSTISSSSSSSPYTFSAKRVGVLTTRNAHVFDLIGREPSVHELLRGSVKLRVMLDILQRLHSDGHRTLIFSQSKLMLDIIQTVISFHGIDNSRIDGTVKGKDRERVVDGFRGPNSRGPSVCLLTTKACGVGITLTGADRVIIFDPSWNPAEDRQAVDRIFRIGQTKNCFVYRFIMASSIEEKMYEKQVFKDGLRVVTESGVSSRYFPSKDQLFELGPANDSVVMSKLWQQFGKRVQTFEDSETVLKGVLGVTRHDTLYIERKQPSPSPAPPVAPATAVCIVSSNQPEGVIGSNNNTNLSRSSDRSMTDDQGVEDATRESYPSDEESSQSVLLIPEDDILKGKDSPRSTNDTPITRNGGRRRCDVSDSRSSEKTIPNFDGDKEGNQSEVEWLGSVTKHRDRESSGDEEEEDDSDSITKRASTASTISLSTNCSIIDLTQSPVNTSLSISNSNISIQSDANNSHNDIPKHNQKDTNKGYNPITLSRRHRKIVNDDSDDSDNNNNNNNNNKNNTDNSTKISDQNKLAVNKISTKPSPNNVSTSNNSIIIASGRRRRWIIDDDEDDEEEEEDDESYTITTMKERKSDACKNTTNNTSFPSSPKVQSNSSNNDTEDNISNINIDDNEITNDNDINTTNNDYESEEDYEESGGWLKADQSTRSNNISEWSEVVAESYLDYNDHMEPPSMELLARRLSFKHFLNDDNVPAVTVRKSILPPPPPPTTSTGRSDIDTDTISFQFDLTESPASSPPTTNTIGIRKDILLSVSDTNVSATIEAIDDDNNLSVLEDTASSTSTLLQYDKSEVIIISDSDDEVELSKELPYQIHNRQDTDDEDEEVQEVASAGNNNGEYSDGAVDNILATKMAGKGKSSAMFTNSNRNQNHQINDKKRPHRRRVIYSSDDDDDDVLNDTENTINYNRINQQDLTGIAIQPIDRSLNAAVAPFPGKILHSRSGLSEQDRLEYNLSLKNAEVAEVNGNWEDAISLYIRAIEICDDDKNLHEKLFKFGCMLKSRLNSNI